MTKCGAGASDGEPARYAHLYLPELWFPVEIPVIEVEAADQAVVGSSLQLRRALTEVNEETVIA